MLDVPFEESFGDLLGRLTPDPDNPHCRTCQVAYPRRSLVCRTTTTEACSRCGSVLFENERSRREKDSSAVEDTTAIAAWLDAECGSLASTISPDRTHEQQGVFRWMVTGNVLADSPTGCSLAVVYLADSPAAVFLEPTTLDAVFFGQEHLDRLTEVLRDHALQLHHGRGRDGSALSSDVREQTRWGPFAVIESTRLIAGLMGAVARRLKAAMKDAASVRGRWPI